MAITIVDVVPGPRSSAMPASKMDELAAEFLTLPVGKSAAVKVVEFKEGTVSSSDTGNKATALRKALRTRGVTVIEPRNDTPGEYEVAGRNLQKDHPQAFDGAGGYIFVTHHKAPKATQSES